MADPFAAHPELRSLIRDPSTSTLRNLYAKTLGKEAAKPAPPAMTVRSPEAREASRLAALADQMGDLWVFAYGSLMWDPAIDFTEVRRAWLPGYARRFILCDVHGARGTHEAPGLMAALDRGEGCHGLAFRVPAERVEDETRNLWAREMVLPSYVPRLLPVHLGGESVTALVFLADHGTDMIQSNLTREQQVRYLATGTGFLGSSRDYLETVAKQFAVFGVDDPEVSALMTEVRAYIP
ncbi:MAG: cation transport protein ChaC [Rhodobacteraceae bacterium]|nr:MAG: cation transport protein ChaC [Paracoccaceae bacterium]